MTTLIDVISFIQTANPGQKQAIMNALGLMDGVTPSHEAAVRNDRADTRQAKATATLSQIGVGESVSFPYDGATYHGIVEKINRLTAKIKITKIDGMTRNRITAGMGVKVSASILARGL